MGGCRQCRRKGRKAARQWPLGHRTGSGSHEGSPRGPQGGGTDRRARGGRSGRDGGQRAGGAPSADSSPRATEWQWTGAGGRRVVVEKRGGSEWSTRTGEGGRDEHQPGCRLLDMGCAPEERGGQPPSRDPIEKLKLCYTFIPIHVFFLQTHLLSWSSCRFVTYDDRSRPTRRQRTVSGHPGRQCGHHKQRLDQSPRDFSGIHITAATIVVPPRRRPAASDPQAVASAGRECRRPRHAAAVGPPVAAAMHVVGATAVGASGAGGEEHTTPARVGAGRAGGSNGDGAGSAAAAAALTAPFWRPTRWRPRMTRRALP